MPVSSRSSSEKPGNRIEPIARRRSIGVAAPAGFPGGMMPAPAHDASFPRSPRSNTSTDEPLLRQEVRTGEADDPAADDRHVRMLRHAGIVRARFGVDVRPRLAA